MIKGTTSKNNPNLVEHQWFPVEYFSGSDVTIYFGDVFLSECSGFQFGIEERVQPIYGYASHAWDCVGRGTRIISGSFEIPFTEAGYLDAILMHIGQYTSDAEKVKPKLAYKLAGEKLPSWCADYKMDIEGLFNLNDPGAGGKDSGQKKKTTSTTKKNLISPGTSSQSVALLKAELNDTVGYQDTPLSRFIKTHYGVISEKTCKAIENEMESYDNEKRNAFEKALQETINYIFENDDTQRFKNKSTTGYTATDAVTRELTQLNTDGCFDYISSSSLELILKWFNYPPNKITYRESEIYLNTDCIKIDSGILMFLLGLSQETKYDAQTYLQVTASQALSNQARTGEATTKATLPTNKPIGSPVSKPKPSYGDGGQFTRWEDRTARYESEIWGRDFTEDTQRTFQSYFYTDRYRNAGLNGEKMLKKYGFDVYITYGPAADAQRYAAWKTKNPSEAAAISAYGFKTTVKAIRNIQITSSSQVIGANGQAIAERYNFIARDLD